MGRILVGTTKGAFIIDEDEVAGPFCEGWPINHVIGDPGTGALWAAGGGAWDGAGVWRSPDGGKTWDLAKLAAGQADAWAAEDPDMARTLGLPPPTEAPFEGIEAIWSLGRAGPRLLAGAKPAALFASDDGGTSWFRLDALTDHPSAKDWSPGAAGLTLHTILSDPADSGRLWVGISAAGVFASEDGGATWDRRNRLSNAVPSGTHAHPAAPCGNQTGLCVHNIVRAPVPANGKGTPRDLLYQQNHHGTYRSRDGGRSWDDITPGLPSTFGFPVAVHPADPDTIWVLPLNGDGAGRYPPDAAAAVWRSRDGGESWTRCDRGLPARNCYFTVLRQAMAAGEVDGPRVAFGTNTGSVFASRDEGDTWDEVARHLPTVLSVELLDTG